VPQADVPEKVIELVELATHGLEAQFDDRQVGYYRKAAWLLGFLDDAYRPTAAGHALTSLPAIARLARFALAFEWSACGKAWANFVGAQSLLAIDPLSAEEFLRTRTNCSASTSARRKTTLRAWLHLARLHHPAVRTAEGLPDNARDPERPRSVAVFSSKDSGRVVRELCEGTRHLRVATAYLTVQGYQAVAARLQGSILRLLVGSEDAVRRIPDVLEYLRRSIEVGSATDEKRDAIHRLRNELVAGTARVHLFDARYHERLHAKVYLFDRRAAYVTSANLTHGGLRANIEAGHVVVDRDQIEHYIARFEDLFASSMDLLPELLPEIEASWAFLPPVPPYLLYLRVLLELFGDVPDLPDVDLALADYQRMIVGSVLQVLRDERGGLLIAPTGTGKTVMAAYTAAALFVRSVRRVFVLCPNDSLAAQWEESFRQFAVPCETITHGILRQAEASPGTSPKARRLRSLLGTLQRTDLVIIDEAHAFRNPRTSGYRTVQALLAGSAEHGRPRTLLLTATPMSTGIDDLNALLAHVGHEQLRSVADVAQSRTVVNVTRPFIEEYFGEPSGDGADPPFLRFGSQRRCFARIRFRKATYPFGLQPVLEAIRRLPLVFIRDARVTGAIQDALPGVDPGPAPATTRDLGPLLRLLLMRRAESSPAALRDSLRKLSVSASDAAEPNRLRAAIEELVALTPDPSHDGKLAFLCGRLRDRPPEEKILIFTTYVSTAHYLRDTLAQSLEERRVELITGEMPEGTRQKILSSFAPSAQRRRGPRRKRGDVQVLIATDAIAEGENLQDATLMVNYDLHWTPLRLIQRVGRVDRPTAHVRHVEVDNFYPGSILFEEFVQLWTRLRERSEAYDTLARTRVLDEAEPDLVVDERDMGLVRGIYEEASWERLLTDFLPTSSHLAHFAKATEAERQAALRLPMNFRATKTGPRSGAFALIRHNSALHCVTDAATGDGAVLASTEDSSHEALIPVISCQRTEPSAPEPSDGRARIHRLLERWAERSGADADELEVLCAEVVVERGGVTRG